MGGVDLQHIITRCREDGWEVWVNELERTQRELQQLHAIEQQRDHFIAESDRAQAEVQRLTEERDRLREADLRALPLEVQRLTEERDNARHGEKLALLDADNEAQIAARLRDALERIAAGKDARPHEQIAAEALAATGQEQE
jgi:hypothetical protein